MAPPASCPLKPWPPSVPACRQPQGHLKAPLAWSALPSHCAAALEQSRGCVQKPNVLRTPNIKHSHSILVAVIDHAQLHVHIREARETCLKHLGLLKARRIQPGE